MSKKKLISEKTLAATGSCWSCGGETFSGSPHDCPDSAPSPSGLQEWIKNLKSVVGAYGQKVSELTATNEELMYAIAGVTAIIVDRFSRDIREGDGPMDVAERLLEELHLLRNENELQNARIQGMEKELESLRTPK